MQHPDDKTLSTPAKEQGKTNDIKDITPQLGAMERQLIVHKLIEDVEEDHHKVLLKIRERLDKVGVDLPTVEVKFRDLYVEAECQVVHGKPLPTLRNSLKRPLHIFDGAPCIKASKAKLSIIKGVSGVIKPSRMTLLLGPPGCGKSTLLKALAGRLDHSLQVSGEVYYNGCCMENILMPQRTSAYISQYNLHTPEMTVTETLDFSARCQGVGSWTDIMLEVWEREKQARIVPDPEIDAFMKAISASGLENSVRTDYILKILGLTNCADTIVGDAMRRGISGGEKRRLGTAEMLVGPQRALFMDEVSNGLDSSTTFQIITCIQQLVHVMGYTALISLLQPAPEVFDLFDDILLFAEGKMVYHGPKEYALRFFQDCGFKCPRRKAIADFLQEVISEKDQKQYWCHNELPYKYVSVDEFSAKLAMSSLGEHLNYELSKCNDTDEYQLNLLHSNSSNRYCLTKWELFKACLEQELLTIRRNSTFYSLKAAQLLILAVITMTVFFRSTMNVDLRHTNYYLSSLFYGIVRIMVSAVVELPMTVSRLPVFYKQRDLHFYPAWIYCIPSCLMKVPLSLLESLVWTAATYYGIGYAPGLSRFMRQVLMFFALHQASLALFRFIGSFCQSEVSTIFVGNLAMQTMFFFGGFIVPKPSMPSWLKWGFWSSLVSYVEIGVALNEFRAPRWKMLAWGNLTVADVTLTRHGLDFKDQLYWISLGVVFGFAVLFNICFILAMTFLNSAGQSRPILSYEKLYCQSREENDSTIIAKKISMIEKSTRVVLPFYPLTVTFQHIYYSIDDPTKKKGCQVQLLQDVTGVFRPGILTALMGVSGAGKTTLMDVLSGRKIGGYIGGDIKIGGCPKVQHSFARISGYCEQADIHSPQITIEESLMFSACLRLPSETSIRVKKQFVKQVLQQIELDGIKDMLVGLPGVNGLSNEQRKRLTIAVELVSNPSVIFMDEPTTGLDARAAAIVMRAVKNVADTGRTVVCTVHQPSIDIFEAFDELILMKEGGRIIYSGPLGKNSGKVIDYFQRIPGIPEIRENQNPATWIMQVTNTAVEAKLGIDFAGIYRKSSLYSDNLELVKQLNSPKESTQLRFPTRYPCSFYQQYQACIWKQRKSYWRNPEYNITRLTYMLIMSVLLALLMMQKGNKISNEQDMFNIIGSTYVMLQAIGLNNSASIIPVLATERTVFYRERFAGMYSAWAYSISMVFVEVPYVLAETFLYVLITYPAIGFHFSAYKIIWYTYASLCKLLCDTYLGMMLVAVSPSIKIATILAAASYTLLNLFSGFFLPGPAIPKWWLWFYWISPTSWSLRALFTSQYSDVKEEITAFGEKKTISTFLADYFGYHHDNLTLVAIVLPIFPVFFAALFALFTEKLNFQRM